MLGFGELIFIAALLILFFGARKLPQLGSALGSTVKMFRKGLKGQEDDRRIRDVHEIDDDRKS